MVTTNAPGLGLLRHRHAERKVSRVITGRYLLELCGQRCFAETGNVIIVPRGATLNMSHVRAAASVGASHREAWPGSATQSVLCAVFA
jgi:hypothetical protein